MYLRLRWLVIAPPKPALLAGSLTGPTSGKSPRLWCYLPQKSSLIELELNAHADRGATAERPYGVHRHVVNLIGSAAQLHPVQSACCDRSRHVALCPRQRRVMGEWTGSQLEVIGLYRARGRRAEGDDRAKVWSPHVVWRDHNYGPSLNDFRQHVAMKIANQNHSGLGVNRKSQIESNQRLTYCLVGTI